MGIFDKFASRDELLKAVEAAIQSEKVTQEGEDGAPGKETEVFFLSNEAQSLADELKTKYDAEVKNAQNMRKRAQTAETQIAELKQENARLLATNEEFTKYNPEKQRNEINRLLEEVGNLKADNKGLVEQSEKLNKVIAEFRTKENDRIIEKALIDEATKLGIRAEAMRDVMYRRSMLEVSDIGTVQTKGDGIPVADFLKSEFDASPLWHPVSQGGGSNPGNSNGKIDNTVLFQQAREKGDVGAMLANAPEFKGVTLGK